LLKIGSIDKTYFYSYSDNEIINIWRFNNTQINLFKSFSTGSNILYVFALHNGLIATSHVGTIQIWNINGKLVNTLFDEVDSEIEYDNLIQLKNTNLVSISSEYKIIIYWDIFTGSMIFQINAGSRHNHQRILSITSTLNDSKCPFCLVTFSNIKLVIWDSINGRPSEEYFINRVYTKLDIGNFILFLPFNRMVLTIKDKIFFADLNRNATIKKEFKTSVNSIKYLNNGYLAVSNDFNSSISLYNTKTYEYIQTLNSKYDSKTTSFFQSPITNDLIASLEDGRIITWKLL